MVRDYLISESVAELGRLPPHESDDEEGVRLRTRAEREEATATSKAKPGVGGSGAGPPTDPSNTQSGGPGESSAAAVLPELPTPARVSWAEHNPGYVGREGHFRKYEGQSLRPALKHADKWQRLVAIGDAESLAQLREMARRGWTP